MNNRGLSPIIYEGKRKSEEIGDERRWHAEILGRKTTVPAEISRTNIGNHLLDAWTGQRAAKGWRLRHAICHLPRYEESCGQPGISVKIPGVNCSLRQSQPSANFLVSPTPYTQLRATRPEPSVSPSADLARPTHIPLDLHPD